MQWSVPTVSIFLAGIFFGACISVILFFILESLKETLANIKSNKEELELVKNENRTLRKVLKMPNHE